MDAVAEIDEEQGKSPDDVNVVSLRDNDNDNDNGEAQQDNHDNDGGFEMPTLAAADSAPPNPTHRRGKSSGVFGSFFDRFQGSDALHTEAGQWTSLEGDRHIRFASHRSDINNDEMRGIVATPLESGQGVPMAAGARFWNNIQTEVGGDGAPQFFRGKSDDALGDGSHDALGGGGGGGGGGGEGLAGGGSQMYRLQATRGSMDVGCFRRTLRFLSAIVNCGSLTESDTEQNLYHGCAGDPNRWLVYFFFWLFRKGWTTVIVITILWYYGLILLFAGVIVGAAELDADCVKVGGVNMGELENRSKFVDAFSLSWNTFSTVGYGSTSPALSTQNVGTGGDVRCAFINFLTSLEAFVGMIFAGFVGAIFYAKVARITQRADIRFSDPLTVRFGSGVDERKVDDDEDRPQDIQENCPAKKAKKEISPLERFKKLAKKVSKPSPFPVITFRIANEMHGTLGGEIVGASVKAVVLIESTKYDDEVSDDLAKEIAKDRMRRASKDIPKMRNVASKRLTSTSSERRTNSERSSDITSMTDEESAHSSERGSSRGSDNAVSYLQGLNALAHKAKFGAKKMKIDEEEGSGSKIVPRMIFTQLELETSEHPLFQRIWRFKHHINQDSPLLTHEAQKAILKNNGKWPWEWNNPKAVRKAIRFNQMVVSFTGISNITGASVYKQKVYDYVDTVVGYQFVNALYRGRRGNLKVDLRLINDVIEQTGGGGEQLKVAGTSPVL